MAVRTLASTMAPNGAVIETISYSHGILDSGLVRFRVAMTWTNSSDHCHDSVLAAPDEHPFDAFLRAMWIHGEMVREAKRVPPCVLDGETDG